MFLDRNGVIGPTLYSSIISNYHALSSRDSTDTRNDTSSWYILYPTLIISVHIVTC